MVDQTSLQSVIPKYHGVQVNVLVVPFRAKDVLRIVCTKTVRAELVPLPSCFNYNRLFFKLHVLMRQN